MSAGSLAILADYEDDDTDLDDTANPESKVYGSHLRGHFTVSQDGRCPRCETNNVLFVILDELFPTGDMPEILYDLIAKGKAVLWSSQVKKGCKAPPTFLCRGFCPPDPLGAGFNINWSKNTLRDIFFSAKATDPLDSCAEDYVNFQQGMYNPNSESGNQDVQESTEVSNDNGDNDDEEEEEEEDDDDDDIDEDELIKQMLAKEAMKAQENAETDAIQPNITSEITETENPVQMSDETRTIYYTPSSITTSTDTTENKDDKRDDLKPATQIAQLSTETNKVYPVSSNGACPYCTSKNVQYIIVCTSDLQDKDLPYTLRELLKREQAFKMAKGENDPPSFLCRNCQYGFNLDWSVTNLELIFGIPKKPSKKQQVAAAAAAAGHGFVPHMGYPPPRVPPMAPPANVPPPALPPRGYPPPYQGTPPPAVRPPALGPPGAFPMPPPRLPLPRVQPPYSHGHPRFTPPPAYPPRVPPPGYAPPVVPPQLPPHAPPRFPPPPPSQGSPRYPVHGTLPHLPRVPPRFPPPPPFGQYPRAPPRYPPPGDYHYGYQQQFRPPAGYPPVEAGYHGYPGYGHSNPYYPPQAPPMPPPPGQFPYQHPPYYQPTSGYPPMRPPGYSQPPAPGTENYHPTQIPTSYPSSYHKTHSEHTPKTESQSLTTEEKEQEDQHKDQVIDEKSLEDSQRFEELLNQIDHSRGVTSSERSDLDLDWSQNEPNSISEEHEDAEYDERPPGDDYDDITTEFQTVPSATKKQKSKVESKKSLPDQESADITMETASTEAQEPTSNITEPCQEQTEESEETMETSDEVTAKEMVVKETTVGKKAVGTPKGRRGRKRKAAEEPREETITKQPKVTDESSQEACEVVKIDDGDSVQQSANEECEEPVPKKESKPIGRRGTRGRKATNQSKQATNNEVSESNEMEEDRKDTVSSEVPNTEPSEKEQLCNEEVKVQTVMGKARRSRRDEDKNHKSGQLSGMEAVVPPPSTSTRQRRGRSQTGLPDKEAETTTKATVTSTRQQRGRPQKEKVEKESEPNIETEESEQTILETSVNEGQSCVTNTSATERQRGRSQRATKMEVLVTNQGEEGTSMETDDTATSSTKTEISTAPEPIQLEDKEGDITETDPTDSKQSDIDAPAGRRRGRRQRGSSKEADSTDTGHPDLQQSDMEASSATAVPAGRRRGRRQRGSSKEADSTDTGHSDSQQSDVEAPLATTVPAGRRRGWLQRGSSKEADSTDTGHTDLQQSDMEASLATAVPAGRRRGRRQRGSSKEADSTDTGHTDSQLSDMEASLATAVPAGRRRGWLQRGSSKEADSTDTGHSDSQQSDVETPSATAVPAGRRRGRRQRGSSKEADSTDTGHSDSQQSDVEAPLATAVPAGRRRGWLQRGSSKEADSTDTGYTDSQQSDVEAPLATTVPAGRRRGRGHKDKTTEELTDPQESDVKATAEITTPAERKSGRSLKGSSKKADTDLPSESAFQEPATTSLDDSAPSDVGHDLKTPTSRKGKTKKTRQEQPDNDSTSQSEEQNTEGVVRKKPTRKRKSSDLCNDVDSGSTSQMDEQDTDDNQTVGRRKTARIQQSSDMSNDVNPGDNIKNQGKKTQTRNTPNNDNIEDTSDNVEMSNLETSIVSNIKCLSRASIHKEQSTEPSLLADDTVESQHLEPSAKPTRGHKVTTGKTSRVLRKKKILTLSEV